MQNEDRAFPFLPLNRRDAKPRGRGITEIRGPYHTPPGRRQLEDRFDTMGAYVDILKVSGGSFAVMPGRVLRDLIELCHAHDVLVSTGGFIERVLTWGPDAVERYLRACREFGFDIVEVSRGFVTLPVDDLVRLTERVQWTIPGSSSSSACVRGSGARRTSGGGWRRTGRSGSGACP